MHVSRDLGDYHWACRAAISNAMRTPELRSAVTSTAEGASIRRGLEAADFDPWLIAVKRELMLWESAQDHLLMTESDLESNGILAKLRLLFSNAELIPPWIAPLPVIGISPLFLSMPELLTWTIPIISFSATGILLTRTAFQLSAQEKELEANEPDLESTKRALEEAHEALISALVDKSALPAARQLINARTENAQSWRLGDNPAPGLQQILPKLFILDTKTSTEVEHIIETHRTAALGIAGPRGSGKTTLINWFCNNERSMMRWDLRILVNAPVHYEPRDFFLHVFSLLCEAIIGRQLPAWTQEENPHLPPQKVRFDSLLRAVAPPLVRIFIAALGLATGYISYVFVRRYLEIPLSPVTINQSLTLVALGWISTSMAAGARAYYRSRSSVFVMHRTSPVTPLLTLSALFFGGAIGLVYTAINTHSTIDTQLLLAPYGIATCASLGSTSWRLLKLWQRGSPSIGGTWSAPASTLSALQKKVAIYRQHVHFQQSYTSGWGGKVSAATKFVFSGEISSTAGQTSARQPWTLPDIIAKIREVLGEAATNKRIVLGFDEVDKIESSEEVTRFINDLKAIFHIDGCFYLVSVSDDAISSFERRGLPFRSTFDSAFDDIFQVPYCSFLEARKLLAERVVGLPLIFAALCHVLSGGLPRDLLRTTRHLYSLSRPIGIGSAAAQLARKELLGKIPLIIGSVRNLDVDCIARLVLWAEQISRVPIGSAELSEYLSILKSENMSTSGLDTKTAQSIRRAIHEAEAVGYLALTVVEYCQNLDGAEIDPSVASELSELAGARQKLSIHPVISAELIQEFRMRNNLRALDMLSLA
jgi:hypothetical protein